MASDLPKSHTVSAKFLALAYGFIVLFIYALPLLPPAQSGSAYIGIHLVATGLMLWAWAKGVLGIRQLLIIGIFLRLVLIPMAPITSNDTERYLWDGAVTLAGHDTYTVSPDHPAAQDLRALWPTPPEHAKYATIYPPGALALFSVSALAGPEMGFWIWKLLLTAASIGSLFLMRTLLKEKDLQQHFALFALSPLLIMETGIGAHLDGFLVLIVLGALVLLQRQRTLAVGAVIGLGASIKFLPIILLGPLLFSLNLKNNIRIWAGALATVIAIYGIALSLGLTSLGVLPEFIEKWRGGSPFFSFVENSFSDNTQVFVLGAVFLVLVSVAALFAKRGYFFEALIVAFSAPLLISPVVFPWYLSILAAVLAFRPNATLLLWTAAVPFTYETLNQWLSAGVWNPATWPLYAIALALIIGVLIDVFFVPRRVNNNAIAQRDRPNPNGTRLTAI